MPKEFKLYIIAVFVLMAIAVFSCKKLVDVPLPHDQIVADNVFSNDQTALSAVMGLYSNNANSNLIVLNGGASVYCSLSADDIYNVGSNANYDPFTDNALVSSSTIVNTNFWSASYKNIYQANALLEGLRKSKSLTDSLRAQLVSEVLFIRSLNYFYLTNLFGDIPLVLNTDYRANDTMARTSTTNVYTQIAADLEEAKNGMQAAYATNSSFPKERVRANKWSVIALLARVKLYTGDYAKAEELSTSLISSGAYSLDTVSNVFLGTSKEAIFQFLPTNKNTAEGSIFIPPSGTVPLFAVTPSLLNSFEANDRRKTQWLGIYASSSGTVYYYPYKYKVRSSTTVTEFNIVLRLAEQFLIRAEARAQQDNLIGARQDVDTIRLRAGLPLLPSSLSKTDLLSAIEQERRVEFFAEWGHRWLDLKRTGRATAVLGALKGSKWQGTDSLYPIPLAEMLLNPFLSQNDGY
jgi:starch-binding outer membrane protein, SusD/RagB family